jgi:hypothetical protein
LIPGMSRSESAITRGKTQMMLLPPTSFSWTTSYVLTCLQDSWPEIAMKGFKPGTFGSVFWWKATERQWLEVPRNFRANLFASLLVAQWSECWCTSLVAQGSILGMSRLESAITRGKTNTKWCCCHLSSFRGLHAYVLTCLQDSWPENAMKGFEPVTFWTVFWSEAT